ncbi:MAG: integrin alpha [Planctomycetota bacterium]
MGAWATKRATALIVAAGLPTAALAQGDPLAEPFPATSTIGALVDGVSGVRLDGRAISVAGVGDINGDGIDDVAIGGFDAAGDRRVFVVFGRGDGLANPVVLEDLDGTNGFQMFDTIDDESLGVSISAAGDVNDDGVDDMLVGAPSRSGSADSDGAAYVVFGRDAGTAGGFPAEFDLAGLDGSNGVRLEPIGGIPDRLERFGAAVSSAGDVNGDGIGDVAVGARAADVVDREYAGRVYVFFGTREPFPAVLSGADLDGMNGLRINGPVSFSGTTGAAGGSDVNADGVEDLVVNTRLPQDFVVFGQSGGFPADLDLGDIDGTNGFVIDSGLPGCFCGDVAMGGDFNGDGIDDLVATNPFGGPQGVYGLHAGQSFVVFGRRDGFPAQLDLASLDGTNGVRIDGDEREDFSGGSVAFANDVDGDGFDDLLLGAEFRGSTTTGSGSYYSFDAGPGAAYVVFGRSDGLPPVLGLAELGANQAIRIDGERRGDLLGGSIAAAGDVNGDGRTDVIVGSREDDAYVVYGRGASCAPDLDGDGELTIFDFLEFQNLFDAMDPAADFDDDGDLTIFDFLAFQNAFDAGCP